MEYASLRDGESACFSAAGLPGSGTDKPGRNEWGNLLRGDDFPFKAGDRYRQYYFQEKVEIGEEMTAGELHDELMEKGADLLLKTVQAMEAGDYPLTDQCGLLRGREAVLAPKIFKEDMKIRWNGKLETICNHIRGLSPFPGAWTELQAVGKDSGVLTLKIFKAARIRQSHNLPAGEVRTDGKTFFDVYVEGGIVRVLELQLSGKKECGRRTF